MVVTILSALVQAEQERILGRTNERRLETRAKGVRFGRKPIINSGHVLTLHSEGLVATEIAKRMKIRRTTVYKFCMKVPEKNKNMPLNLTSR